MIDEEIGGEVVEYVQHENQAPATLFRTDDPVEIVERATATANALASVVVAQKLAKKISGRDHVLVEGWTLLGSMLGVFPVTAWTRRIGDGTGPADGWEARVEARTRDGAVVGAAEAQCVRTEDLWGWNPRDKYGKALKPRDDFALRSMAQTRATSKALRHPLGFVMTLAGFEATPAEEMPRDDDPRQAPPEQRPGGQVDPAWNWRDWTYRMDQVGVPADDSREWLRQACAALGVDSLEEADHEARKGMLGRANAVLFSLTELNVDLALYEKSPRPVIAVAFAEAFDGAAVEGPSWRIHASETDRPSQFAPPSAEELAEAESIPFGE